MSNLSAIIKNGIVDNIIVGDIGFAQSLGTAVDVTGMSVGIGWSYAAGVFSPPTPVTPPAPNYGTKVTRLAFRNRFTGAEKVALYTAANSNIQLKIYLDDLAAATFVDLSRVDTIGSINALASAGILTSARATTILTAGVAENEVPVS